MEVLTVARRARFRKVLINRYAEALKRLQTAKQYSERLLEQNMSFSEDQWCFHRSNLLTGILAVLEAYLSDILVEFLECFPGRMKDKDLSLDSLSKAGSVGQLIRQIARRHVNGLQYGGFRKFIEEASNLLGFPKMDTSLIENIVECKATRNAFVHAGGKCNQFYINEVEEKYRRVSLDEMIPISAKYLSQSLDLIEKFMKSFHDGIPDRLNKYGQSKAFNEMWDSCHLATVLSFEQVWDIVDEEMVSPTDFGLKWRWSHSEQPVFDFFLRIYNPMYVNRTDTTEAIRRWPSDTDVGKVIASWIDSPFWF